MRVVFAALAVALVLLLSHDVNHLCHCLADACQPLNNAGWVGGTKIIMVDRGDCTFVTKVRHAQTAGGSAVIVVDNVDEVGSSSLVSLGVSRMLGTSQFVAYMCCKEV